MKKEFQMLVAFLVLLAVSQLASATDPFWTEVVPIGTKPPPLWNGGSAYDKQEELFYIFGGQNSSVSPNDFPVNSFYRYDVDNNIWTQLPSTPGPSPRAEPLTWVGRATGVVYVAGGRGQFRLGQDTTKSDTWRYRPTTNTWNLITQTPAQQQIANRSTEAILVHGNPFVFSGSRSTLSRYINRPGALQTDVAYFERNGGGWESAGTPNPSPTPRSYFALGYSADRELLYIYGGYTADPAGVEVFAEVNYLGDLWKFRLTTRTWVQINPENAGPGKRDNAKMIVDDQNNLIYIYGGADWTGKVYNDLWVFNDNTDTWSLVIPDGAPGSPPPTIGVYWFIRKIRRTRLEFFIFGGSSGDGTGTLTNKMYKLSIPV